ncbi:hypothetical protein FRC05_007617 [Tulasnella sp. 425]|nr:hypothetical protein FRC05_007617 [Tulasnella sp. 425]
MSFDLLPPDPFIRILYCHDVVRLNESAVYQAAAELHGFIAPSKDRQYPPPISEVTRRPDATGFLDGAASWKEICKAIALLVLPNIPDGVLKVAATFYVNAPGQENSPTAPRTTGIDQP